MELMQPKFGWTIKTIDSLAIYCQFHLRELAQKSIRCEAGPWEEYSNVLHTFSKDIRGGIRKRCEEVRNDNLQKKYAEDLKAIKNLAPIPVLQTGVKKAYMTLQAISSAENLHAWRYKAGKPF